MSKLQNGLKIKIYLLVSLFLALMIINISIISYLIEDKKDDSEGINLTTRQSVLVQKYIKNFFFFMETKKIQDVTQVVKEFEGNSQALLHGKTPVPLKDQPTPVPGEDPVILYAVDGQLDAHVVKELQSINAKWLELKSLAIKLLSVTPEEKIKGYESLVVFGEKLSSQIDALASYHEQKSDAKFGIIQKTQLVIISLSLIATLFIVVFFNRTFLRKAFQSFDEIKEFTSSLGDKTDAIYNSSTDVSNNSKDLTTSIEQTMAAVTELTEITKMNQENTERSKASSTSCSKQAEVGKSMVENLLQSIKKISEANERLSSQIEHGNREFKKILELVNNISSETLIINDIVFQTKLLSFNASVEAARAGESGKGFSVVAEEVGNLAAMSGASSKKITSILDSSKKTIEEIIFDNASRTKTIISECQDRVKEGLDLAKSCGNSFELIYGDVNTVDSIITQLASSSREQTSGIEMISKSMYDINSACRLNDSSATEMLTTIESMVANAQVFQTQISSFSELLLGTKDTRHKLALVEKTEATAEIDKIDFAS